MGCANSTAKTEEIQKLITVFGATGAQGGGVVEFLKKDKCFKIRAVTRNPDGEKAKKLIEEGIEVVKADQSDVESLKEAVKGAYGVFLVTQFWEAFDEEKEYNEGKNVVDVVKESGCKHLIFSGLENVEELIGKKCPHFDSKAKLEQYIQESGLKFTIVRYSFYAENFYSLMKPLKDDDGSFSFNIPMGDYPLDVIFVNEAGECITNIFKAPEKFVGQAIGLSSVCQSMKEYATLMEEKLGVKIATPKITTEDYSKLGFPGAEVLAVMFEFYQTGKCDRDVAMTRKLAPSMSTYEEWVDKHTEEMKAAFS
ncbi:DgyrCDS3655 [Dimorphilus gyrociliatus]|uniref:NmrA-like family domain-containing protein 1 n=1 Tax=Dimorphilus gyrociliatus TaxID=2664684 RepID=A0A7I8VDT1_9ANNE|nr:DgyrCDS3655 [Dimorphilus gyrociliatus]